MFSKVQIQSEKLIHTADFACNYDFCIVFPVENGGFTEVGNAYIVHLKRLNFEMCAYYGVNPKKNIFVLLRAPLNKLRLFADHIGYHMLLDHDEIKQRLSRGNFAKGIAPLKIEHRPVISHLKPYEQIYGKYSKNVPEELYWRDPDNDSCHPFSAGIRLKLSLAMLEFRYPENDSHVNLGKLLRHSALLDCYPLHDRNITRDLAVQWANYPREKLPLNACKDYFGEKIAMYFAFMQYCTQSLSIPATIGVPLQIIVWVTNNPSGIVFNFSCVHFSCVFR
jgi:hypothetical protein